jgi:hypothetical protein
MKAQPNFFNNSSKDMSQNDLDWTSRVNFLSKPLS